MLILFTMIITNNLKDFTNRNICLRGPRWDYAGHGIRPLMSAGYGIGSKFVAGFGIQTSAGYGIDHKMIAGYGIRIPRGNVIKSGICSVYPKYPLFTSWQRK